MDQTVSTLLSLAGFSILTSLSPAAVVALWDSTSVDYTTGNAVFGATTQNDVDLGLGTPGADDHLEVMSFGPFPASETVPNPYVGPALFGGFYAASSEPAGTPSNTSYALIVRNNPDEIRMQNSFSGSTQRVWRSVVYLPSDPFTLDGATLTLGTGAAANGVDHHFHYVVRSDGKFYVSQDFFTLNNVAAPVAGTYNPNSLAVDSDTTLWKEWDFSLNSGNNFQLDFTGTVTLPENALVDAVGFFMRGNTSGITTSIQTNLRFIGYEAAIPEPALFAPALGLAALMLVRRRRAAVS